MSTTAGIIDILAQHVDSIDASEGTCRVSDSESTRIRLCLAHAPDELGHHADRAASFRP